MRVLGVDSSTKTGLVFLETGKPPRSAVLTVPNLKGMARLSEIAARFSDYLDTLPEVDAIAMEGYAYANAYTLTTLVEIGAVFRLELYRRKLPCYIVPPSVVKKFATGKGNSKKPEMASAVELRWGFTDPSDDVIDAYVLARIAEQMVSGTQPIIGVEILS